MDVSATGRDLYILLPLQEAEQRSILEDRNLSVLFWYRPNIYTIFLQKVIANFWERWHNKTFYFLQFIDHIQTLPSARLCFAANCEAHAVFVQVDM